MMGVTESQVRDELAAKGKSPEVIDQITVHKIHKGNRPTNMLVLEQVTPKSLGALIALYEHKIFTQGILLDILSFDQWGVELGKILAAGIEKEFVSGKVGEHHDASTTNLLKKYIAARKGS